MLKPRPCLFCETPFDVKSPNERYCLEHRGRCLIEGCDRTPHKRERYCSMHYQRIRKHGDAGSLASVRQSRSGLCSVDGCGRGIQARGLCSMHYDRMVDTGNLGGPETKMGKGAIHHSGYRYIQNAGKSVAEHRLVMELMLGRTLRASENVHHIDGDRLNNDPSNLELWVRRQPPGQRAADRVRAAIALLQDYPELAADEGYGLLELDQPHAAAEHDRHMKESLTCQ